MKQQERTENTRRRILDAAMEEFGTNGYRGGTIGNICRTGINKGLIYHNFGDKDSLYLECVRISCRKLMDRLKAVEGVDRTADVPVGPGEKAADVPTEPGKDPAEGTEGQEGEMSEDGIRSVIQPYMQARVEFYRDCEKESKIVFESLLDPPQSLKDRIREIMDPLEDLNKKVYRELLSHVTLRQGVTKERAEKYFMLVQYMFNAYFSSPAMREKSLTERITVHEQSVPEILDFMIYGIAEKKDIPEKKGIGKKKSISG